MTEDSEQVAAIVAYKESMRELAETTIRYRKVLADYDDLRESVSISDAEQLEEMKHAYHDTLANYNEMMVAYARAKDAWVEANPIRSERTARGLTLLDLANVAGKSIGAIQLWERGGAKRPDVQGIENIAQFFGQPDLRERLRTWKSMMPLAIFPPRPKATPGA